MDQPAAPRLGLNFLADAADFQLGSVRVSPSRRKLQGAAGERHLQPQVMLVFLCLVRHRDDVVSRRALFDICWPGLPVGDDSLNRTVTALRHALVAIRADDVAVETVPRSGYRLVVTGDNVDRPGSRERAIEAAWDCWRLGLPKPDAAEIAALSASLFASSGPASDWGTLALLLRKAVEYADPADCADLVRRCEQAARKALTLDPKQANARIALAGLMPVFGDWSAVRSDLIQILEYSPDHPVALHDLAVIEMATGRPSAAAPIVESLLRSDRFAATYYYKRMYHLWTIGDLQEAERIADRALALWPHHPAIWTARFWTLIYTRRADQARRMAEDENCRNFLPVPMLLFLRRTADLLAGGSSPAQIESHVAEAVAFAARGPAQSVAALMSLCAFESVDRAFDVAFAYYAGSGPTSAPMRWREGDPRITDQHRRVSQPLFIPSSACLRRDPRFASLCDAIGLTEYWNSFGLVPDHLATDGFAGKTERKRREQ